MVPPDQHGATRECQEVKLLLLPILLADPGVSAEEHAAFEARVGEAQAAAAGAPLRVVFFLSMLTL